MSLREAIQAQHDAAEAHAFTALLLSGEITPAKYSEHLVNHALIFSAIESRLAQLGLLVDLPDFKRCDKIIADLAELTQLSSVRPSAAAIRCVDRINQVDAHSLMAYVYVYHFADMYGGQMIKSKVPGSATRYDYEDRSGLIAQLRPLLSDDLAEEAQKAFAFTLELFDELSPSTA